MTIAEFEERAAAGTPLSASEAAAVLASPDLTVVGQLGEIARRRVSGDEITFARVLEVSGTPLPASAAEAGEVRLTAPIATIDEALELVAAARPLAGTSTLTGFSVHALLRACGGSLDVLEAAASRLRAAGLEAVAECAVDEWADTPEAIAALAVLERGGLPVPRLTVNRAPRDVRLPLIERAASIAAASPGVQAFAPLPRQDSSDQPSTGYDDVRTVAVARLMCTAIPRIQVDWPLYGPKLAQVALMYGANDVDGVAPVNTSGLGSRRSPLEDIRRQIRAAAGEPVERNGRFERLS
jgi:aminodeoxyfutalosine synthase